jgi:hypothetical protein
MAITKDEDMEESASAEALIAEFSGDAFQIAKSLENTFHYLISTKHKVYQTPQDPSISVPNTEDIITQPPAQP